MTSKNGQSSCLRRVGIALSGLSAWIGAAAAPLDLPNTPLFLGTPVPPNIMLLIDDSNSMGWSLVTHGQDGVLDGYTGVAQPECTNFVRVPIPDLPLAPAYHGDDCDSPDDGGLLVREDDLSRLDQGLRISYNYTIGNSDGQVRSSAFSIAPVDELFIDDPRNPNFRPLPTNTTDGSGPPICAMPDPTRTGFWRAYNSAFNSLYYDPQRRYIPWSGADNSGAAFSDADPTAARLDPYDGSQTPSNLMDLTQSQDFATQFVYGNTDNDGNGTIDPAEMCSLSDGSSGTIRRVLSVRNNTVTANPASPQYRYRELRIFPARYYAWSDSNFNGLVDPQDAHQLIEIRTSGRAGFNAFAPATFYRGVGRTDCSVRANGRSCTAVQELQNFANWFQYYRSRVLTAKDAFGTLAYRTNNVRMGMVTLHDDNLVHMPIRNIDSGNNRATLLGNIYKIVPGSSTPLLTAVNDVGEYLSCAPAPAVQFENDIPYTLDHGSDVDANGVANTLSSTCPALTAANGGAFQKNFLIAMTDGYYNQPGPNVGNTDGDGSSAFAGGAYADTVSNTLADIAMKYYQTDLQPSLPDRVKPTALSDPATHQHMVTYGVAFGIDGTLTANPPDTITPFRWPNPGPIEDGTPEKIDDLRHAAFNGRGQFLSARRPDELLQALLAAISDIGDRIGAATSISLNSGFLLNGTRIYQALLNSVDWSGQLKSIPISSGATPDAPCPTVAFGQPCPPEWDAGQVLNSQSSDSRSIISSDAVTHAGIPFRWASLSTPQQAALSASPTAPYTADAYGPLRVDYLRGDRSNESFGTPRFRIRSSVLGDITDSDPVFVGAPAFDYSFNNYPAFRNDASRAQRTPMIYVGANDGMLHGFRASDGRELLAYVPSPVYGSASQPILSRLTTQSYTHLFTVDGSPTEGDAFFSSDSQWHSVLVSGLRSGGRGVFALDVTDPSRFSEANAASLALWEFTSADDPDLGYTYGQPAIVLLPGGRWVVLVASGYNNTTATDGNPSTTGQAALFVLNVEGPGADGRWDIGRDYQKVLVGPVNTATPNGLAAPAAVDIDGNLGIDRVYAGDLLGNLWRFDVNSSGSFNAAYSGSPLYVARDAAGNAQPITSRPEVGFNSYTPAPNDVTVYFGTGRYLDRADNSTTNQQTQSFYGIFDQDYRNPPALNRSNLLRQSIVQEVARVSKLDTDRSITACGANADTDACFRVTTTAALAAPPAALPSGWYMDLFNTNNGAVTDAAAAAGANKGERMVTTPTLRAGRIIFTTTIPSASPFEYGGGGWLMELDAQLGARIQRGAIDVTTNGTVDQGDQVDVTINGQPVTVPVSGVRSTVGIQSRPGILSTSQTQERKFFSGSTGNIGTITESPGGRLGRVTWRELTPP